MKTVKIKGYVHLNPYGHGMIILSHDLSAFGYPPVGPVEFDYDLPEGFDEHALRVAGLDHEIDILRSGLTPDKCADEQAKLMRTIRAFEAEREYLVAMAEMAK